MLIAGCSHTSGSEIDGEQDSVYNRQHSFGNQLANKMGYRAVNIASPSSTNSTIARSVIEWFSKDYDSRTMEVFIVVAWTESTRMEVPVDRICWYEQHTPYGDWFAESSRHYLRVNSGYAGSGDSEKELIKPYHRFMADNEKYLDIASANLVLQLQYMFKMYNVDYVMCNVMHMFTPGEQLNFYTSQIDATKYFNLGDNDNAFYWKYRNAGYTNPKAKYWHHNEIPHSLYATELYNFIESNKCL